MEDKTRGMSRRLAIFIFWLLGFTIGAVGYLAAPNLATWIGRILPDLIVNQAILGSIIAGIVGSIVSTFTVVAWASKSE